MQRVGEIGRFNAQLLGIAADGVTDVTTALHALIAAVGEGAELVFPKGDYLIGALTASVANQTWTFAKDATLLLADGEDDHMLRVTAAGVTIRGGVFDGNGANQTGGWKGIYVQSDGVTLDDVEVLNADGAGIWSWKVSRTYLRRCTVVDSGSTGIFVEIASGGTDEEDVTIEGCRVYRQSLDPATASGGGIAVHGYEAGSLEQIGTRIAGNIVRLPVNPTNSMIGIEVFGLATESDINGNKTYGGSMGISVDASDGSTVNGNKVYNFKTNGIELAGSQHCTVDGNVVRGNGLGSNGIICSNTPTGYNTIGDNTVTGCTSRGIKAQTSPHTTIGDNTVKHTSGYAIEVISSDGCTVEGNSLDGQSSASKAIVLDTSSRITVDGNTMEDFTQHGVFLTASSAVTLDYITIGDNTLVNVNVPLGSSLSGGAALGSRIRATGNPGMVTGVWSYDVRSLLTNLREAWGTGSPEGVLTAGVGSRAVRTDGGASTTEYLKESGTGNTGWRAV